MFDRSRGMQNDVTKRKIERACARVRTEIFAYTYICSRDRVNDTQREKNNKKETHSHTHAHTYYTQMHSTHYKVYIIYKYKKERSSPRSHTYYTSGTQPPGANRLPFYPDRRRCCRYYIIIIYLLSLLLLLLLYVYI